MTQCHMDIREGRRWVKVVLSLTVLFLSLPLRILSLHFDFCTFTCIYP